MHTQPEPDIRDDKPDAQPQAGKATAQADSGSDSDAPGGGLLGLSYGEGSDKEGSDKDSSSSDDEGDSAAPVSFF